MNESFDNANRFDTVYNSFFKDINNMELLNNVSKNIMSNSNIQANVNQSVKMMLDQFNASQINTVLLDPKNIIFNADGSFDKWTNLLFKKIVDASNKDAINNILTKTIVLLEKLKSKCYPDNYGVKK